MTKKELMVKAHEMTREIKSQYPTVDYKFQLGLCLSYLQVEGDKEMVELKGSEKQVKWANDLREMVLSLEEVFGTCVNNATEMKIKECGMTVEFVNSKFEELKNCDSAKKVIDTFSRLRKYEVEDMVESYKTYNKIKACQSGLKIALLLEKF